MRTVRFSDPTGCARTGDGVYRRTEALIVRRRNGRWRTDQPFCPTVVVTSEKTYGFDEVSILPPNLPTKIVRQVGGYVDHRGESGFEERLERLELFSKTPSCVVSHGVGVLENYMTAR